MSRLYLYVCKYCGRILMKGNNPFITLLDIEIKCSGCGKLLDANEDISVKRVKKRDGLTNVLVDNKIE